MRQRLLPALLATLVLLGRAQAAPSAQTGRPTGPLRIGLALSGGAAYGLAHIGVLKVLEQEGIPFVCVSGNSMGSIVGGMYACGYTPAQMESLNLAIDWNQLFSDQVPSNALNLEERETRARYQVGIPHRNFVPSLPSGALAAQNVYLLLKELTERTSMDAGGDFDSLVIPYRAVAVDFLTGDLVVFRSGSVADAMRASMAIPGIFSPLVTRDAVLVDGGVVQFLPVQPLLEFAPDFIIAVDLRQPRDPNRLPSLVDLAWESFDIATERDHREQLKLADVVIRPDLRGLNASQFNQGQEFIRRGEAAARASLPELRSRLAGRTLARYRKRIRPRPLPTVRRVGLQGLRTVRPSLVRREIRTQRGAPLDPDRLLRDLQRIHRTGFFSSVTYSLTRVGPDSVDVGIALREREFGAYRLGLAYDQANRLRFAAEVAQENLLGSGAGVGLGVVLGNPQEAWLRYSGARFFGLPFNYRLQGFGSLQEHRAYQPDGAWSGTAYTASLYGATARFGVNLGRNSYFKAGLDARDARLSPDSVAFRLFGHRRETVGALAAEFKIRNYSALLFPYHGLMLQVRTRHAVPWFGSDYDCHRAEIDFAAPLRIGRRAVFEPAVSIGATFDPRLRFAPDSSVPVIERFRLGGPELAGADFEERLTAHRLVLGVSFRYLLFRLFRSDEYPCYLRLDADLATFRPVPEVRPADVYYGTNLLLTQTTPIGPLRVGAGYCRPGRLNFYFSFGFNLLQDLPR